MDNSDHNAFCKEQRRNEKEDKAKRNEQELKKIVAAAGYGRTRRN